MKKKIIFITKALWIGGIETALVNLLKQFDYDRYDVTLLVLKAELDMLPQINPRCRVIILDRDSTVTATKSYRHSRLSHLTEEPESPSRLHQMMMWSVPVIRWVENWLYIRYVRDLMQTEAFDTAIIYSDVVGEIGVRSVRAKQYFLYYHHGAMRRVYHDEAAYRACRKIIVVSEALAEKLRAFRPEYADKITAVNNLLDIDGVISKSREAPATDIPETGFHVVSCGRVSPEKGIDLAAEACALLLRGGIRDLHWWIVGGGPAEGELRDLVQRLGIENHFHLLGMQTNPYPYFRRADLYVQPSRFEGHSITILEARLLAKPILATRAAAHEQIEDGVSGMLCESDAAPIADGVRQLYEHPERRTAFSKALERHDFRLDNAASLATLYQYIEEGQTWKNRNLPPSSPRKLGGLTST